MAPYMTMQSIQENVIQNIRVEDEGDKSNILHLDYQYNYGIPDMNAETQDLNRHQNEKIPNYLWRVWNDQIMGEEGTCGIDELVPIKQIQLNSQIKTFNNTYYFSLASASRSKKREKARDVFKEHKKVILQTNNGLDTVQNLKFTNSTKQVKRRAKNYELSKIDYFYNSMKLFINVVSMMNKLNSDSIRMGQEYGLDHLNNRLNKQMNNIMSHDWANRDVSDDTDYILPRHGQEFPRFSYKNQTKHQMKNNEKPWGNVQDPVYVDPFLDENQLSLNESQNYEKGVWYYTSYPQCDHHDLAGIPSIAKDFQTLLGIQFRPTVFINIYNRLRQLDFTSENVTNSALDQNIKTRLSTKLDLVSDEYDGDLDTSSNKTQVSEESENYLTQMANNLNDILYS